LCNARCPLCPRNFHGYPHNDGYVETNLTLDNAKHIFTCDFLQQLQTILINGNLGDAVMNPETPDIVEYFMSKNEHLKIEISTNGSARDHVFWQRLAKTGAIVQFCLDGLEDTHYLYRQNTNWRTILKNAKTFIEAGGAATWKMIRFDHNQHQIQECRELSKKLGFTRFELTDHGRNTGPVYDKRGQLVHVMGNYTGETDLNILFHWKNTSVMLLKDIGAKTTIRNNINCYTKNKKSIYVTSVGEVYPCCYIGFSPRTFGKGNWQQVANSQVAALTGNNNALEYSLEECISWFNLVEESWSKDSFENGRLLHCNNICGQT
jgi:hypothetical protein